MFPEHSRLPGRLRLFVFACAAAVLLVAGIGSLGGCGTAQQVVRGQATVWVENAPERRAFYRSLHEQCDSRHPARAETPQYDECMEPAVLMARAADSYRDSLEAVDEALEAGAGEGEVMARVHQALASARLLVAAYVRGGFPVPGWLADAIADMELLDE